jgi:hypothetical protein
VKRQPTPWVPPFPRQTDPLPEIGFGTEVPKHRGAGGKSPEATEACPPPAGSCPTCTTGSRLAQVLDDAGDAREVTLEGRVERAVHAIVAVVDGGGLAVRTDRLSGVDGGGAGGGHVGPEAGGHSARRLRCCALRGWAASSHAESPANPAARSRPPPWSPAPGGPWCASTPVPGRRRGRWGRHGGCARR